MPKSLFAKLWESRLVAELGSDMCLLYVDRHLITDTGVKALLTLEQRGLSVRKPQQTFAMADHSISTEPGAADAGVNARRLVTELRRQQGLTGLQLLDIGQPGHGIVHVVGPELGITLPGACIVCNDSHSCTHGALGALAFGIGSTEIQHVAATQTIVQCRPRTMRITFVGTPSPEASAKDLILCALQQLGVEAGVGYAIEYAGSAIEALEMEGRMTVCNLTIELGAKFGLVAVDAKTLAYVKGRAHAPRGEAWDAAQEKWRSLQSDPGAAFDKDVEVDVEGLGAQVTWGTTPAQGMPIDGLVPDPAREPDAVRREALRQALHYMDLAPGDRLLGLTIDWVFIGSCTNARLSDLRAAADVVRGRRVAAGVQAWVVPGSGLVKRQAEAEGLDAVFRDAGFSWRGTGCSLCAAANGESVPAGKRCVSTSNRNSVGRQGPGSRTHLASPVTAAASAIAGVITSAALMDRVAPA